MASYNGNASLTYSINSKYFTIDKQSGNVYLISKFRKNKSSSTNTHKFQITATDGKSLVTAANTINLIVVNDQAPIFISKERVFQIDEVFINNIIYHLKVSISINRTRNIRLIYHLKTTRLF